MLEKKYLDQKKKYIVGVSGGCDSMALLDMLVKAHYHVVVAHVNYHKREDSDVDMHLVEQYAKQHRLIFECQEVTTYNKKNFQAQARDIRYQFYLDLLKKYQGYAVLLGHHHDDVLETIYMQKQTKRHHIYFGIKAKTLYQDAWVIRPLLQCRKTMLIDYCKKNGVPYHDDYTNFETYYYRDYVRNKIFNHMSEEEKDQLYQWALKKNQLYQLRQKEVEKLYAYCFHDGKLCIKNVAQTDLYDLYCMYIDQHTNLLFHQVDGHVIEEMVKQTLSPKPNITLSLPVNHVFIKEYDNVYVTKKTQEEDYAYIFETFVDCAYFHLRKEGSLNEGIPIQEDDFPICIRNYRPKDEIKTAGGTKKVNRLFIDKKIPMHQRKHWPILLNRHGEILLIPNIAKNEAYLAINAQLFVIQ